jgi:hypothetical protein
MYFHHIISFYTFESEMNMMYLSVCSFGHCLPHVTSNQPTLHLKAHINLDAAATTNILKPMLNLPH